MFRQNYKFPSPHQLYNNFSCIMDKPSKHIRYSRACSLYSEIINRHPCLSKKLINQCYVKKSSLTSQKIHDGLEVQFVYHLDCVLQYSFICLYIFLTFTVKSKIRLGVAGYLSIRSLHYCAIIIFVFLSFIFAFVLFLWSVYMSFCFSF